MLPLNIQYRLPQRSLCVKCPLNLVLTLSSLSLVRMHYNANVETCMLGVTLCSNHSMLQYLTSVLGEPSPIGALDFLHLNWRHLFLGLLA